MGRLALSLPNVRRYYVALTRGVMRADVARIAMLYVYGGWYVDTDVLCARELSELAAPELDGGEEIVLIEQPRKRNEEVGLAVANFLIGASPHHPLWNATLDNVAARVRALRSTIRADASHQLVLSTTGSGAITEALQELSRRARTPPPRVTQLVEQVPSWLLRQASLSPRAARRGQRTHAGGHLGGGRTAAVMPSSWYEGAPRGGAALRGGAAVCYHLNYFSWGKAWKSFVAGRQRGHQRGGSRKARLARKPKAPGAFAGQELGRRQRGTEARDVPVSALARIPLAKARLTADKPAVATTLAAIRAQVSGALALALGFAPHPHALPLAVALYHPLLLLLCPRPTLPPPPPTRATPHTGNVAARLRAQQQRRRAPAGAPVGEHAAAREQW